MRLQSTPLGGGKRRRVNTCLVTNEQVIKAWRAELGETPTGEPVAETR
jgi:hypothetical protein